MNAEDSTTKPATIAWLPGYHGDDTEVETRQRWKIEQLIEKRKHGYPPRLHAVLVCGGLTAAVAIVVWVLLLTGSGRPRPGHIALSILLGAAVILTFIGWIIIDAAIKLHRDRDAISAQQHHDLLKALRAAAELSEKRHAETLGALQLLCELLKGDRAAEVVIAGAANAIGRPDGRANLTSVRPTSQG